MDISIHDNSLLSCQLSVEKREICLHTAFMSGEVSGYAGVVFSGIVAYFGSLSRLMREREIRAFDIQSFLGLFGPTGRVT